METEIDNDIYRNEPELVCWRCCSSYAALIAVQFVHCTAAACGIRCLIAALN